MGAEVNFKKQSEGSDREESTYLVDHLLHNRPTLVSLKEARNLRDYIAPVLLWPYQPLLFPKAYRLLELITQEIDLCYGREIAQRARSQLEQNFSVETAAHLSLPRLYDRISIQSGPLTNINTLIFQGTLFSASAHLSVGHKLHISCSTGRIFLRNFNNGAYFQADYENAIRLLSNGWHEIPQCFIPPLSAQEVESLLKKKSLSEAGAKRATRLLQSIALHPESLSRQIATLHAALYNEILPPDIQQVTIDYELIVSRFLIELLEDPTTITYQLFSTSEGIDFICNGFGDVSTAWPTGEAPFSVLEKALDTFRLSRQPYQGKLNPSTLCSALVEETIMPKTALIFLLFLVEGGLAPIGGMMQTLYATQIRDRLVKWLRTHRPEDARIESLAHVPTDRAIMTPLWGVKASALDTPLSYHDVLSAGWTLNRSTAEKLLEVEGSAALESGAIMLNDTLFSDQKIPDERKKSMLHNLADRSNILKID